jgi:hypothetical protein
LSPHPAIAAMRAKMIRLATWTASHDVDRAGTARAAWQPWMFAQRVSGCLPSRLMDVCPAAPRPGMTIAAWRALILRLRDAP